MVLNWVDQLWVHLGLQREELRNLKGRGLAYGILFLTSTGSFVLATDMLLNLSGRFG